MSGFQNTIRNYALFCETRNNTRTDPPRRQMFLTVHLPPGRAFSHTCIFTLTEICCFLIVFCFLFFIIFAILQKRRTHHSRPNTVRGAIRNKIIPLAAKLILRKTAPPEKSASTLSSTASALWISGIQTLVFQKNRRVPVQKKYSRRFEEKRRSLPRFLKLRQTNKFVFPSGDAHFYARNGDPLLHEIVRSSTHDRFTV